MGFILELLCPFQCGVIMSQPSLHSFSLVLFVLVIWIYDSALTGLLRFTDVWSAWTEMPFLILYDILKWTSIYGSRIFVFKVWHLHVCAHFFFFLNV